MTQERTSITQITQIALESTRGSYSSASNYRRLGGITIEPSIQAEVQSFRPTGYKWPTLTALNREWTEWSIGGEPTYTEIIYPLASIIKNVSSTAVNSARQWVFESSASVADTLASFAIQHGSAERAERTAYSMVRNFSISGDRSDFEVGGDLIAQRFTDSISLTSTFTEWDLQPILPSETSIYLDTTVGGLGNTQLTRVLSFGFNVGDRIGPLWTLDSSQTSWTTHVETEPTVTYQMVMEADSAGMAQLTQMRDNTRKFLRHESVGGTVVNTSSYTFRIDMAAEVIEIQEFSDEDGVWAIGYTLGAMYDTGWGRAFQVTVINNITSL